MCADIHNKAFTDKVKWASVCGLINIIDPKNFSHLVESKAQKEAPPDVSPSRTKAVAGISELIGPEQFLGYSRDGRQPLDSKV